VPVAVLDAIAIGAVVHSRAARSREIGAVEMLTALTIGISPSMARLFSDRLFFWIFLVLVRSHTKTPGGSAIALDLVARCM
jgi:hypothetical protein